MWEVVFRPEALRDIVKATTGYRKDSRRAGDAFSDAVDAGVEIIRGNPYLYAIVTRHTRRATVPGFPYGLYYRVADDHVVISACTHHSRHPRHWRAS